MWEGNDPFLRLQYFNSLLYINSDSVTHLMPGARGVSGEVGRDGAVSGRAAIPATAPAGSGTPGGVSAFSCR